MSANLTHAGIPRVAAAFCDLAAAGLLSMQVEKSLRLLGSLGYSLESIVAVGFGFLFLSCKDCIGGMSLGKRLFGCVVVDVTRVRPIAPIVAFKRNGKLYGVGTLIFVMACILGSAVGEMLGAIVGIFAMIGLFIRYAICGDSINGTHVVLRSSVEGSN